MSSSEFFKHESVQDHLSITRYLDALSDGFAGRQLVISTEDKRMVLTPQGIIQLEVEAKRKDSEIRLSLKFRWVEKRDQVEADAPKPLTISGVQDS